MNIETNTFKYTYSAKEQKEIEAIRKKYLPKEEDKMEQLRRLDQSVSRKGTIAALICGIMSALVMGIGMCCTMVWGGSLFIPGIIVGVIGIAGIGVAYPIYDHITRKQREKIAPEIMRLTEELSQR